MRFENWPVLGRKVPEYFSNAAVLTRFGQFKRPIDCRCHESRRYHGPAAETNGSFRPIADIGRSGEGERVRAQYRFGWVMFFASSAALAFALSRDWTARAIVFLVITVPLTLWALRAAGKSFIRWNRKPRELTPEQVADFLRRALAGSATDGEIDYFISVDIADPALNNVKDRVGALYGPGWSSEVTRADLGTLLDQVEAMKTAI